MIWFSRFTFFLGEMFNSSANFQECNTLCLFGSTYFLIYSKLKHMNVEVKGKNGSLCNYFLFDFISSLFLQQLQCPCFLSHEVLPQSPLFSFLSLISIYPSSIQDPLPTLLFLRLPLCCFCDPLCCFCGPLCWNVFPFCWFGDPFCCFWSAKWECVFPKCHPPSRMLILYLSRINNSGPSKAKNQQFLSNKTESTNCVDQSLVGSFQDLQMIALWKLSLRRRQSSISPSFLLSFLFK